MKFRADFVTNSSSSSFILAFKDKDSAHAAMCQAYIAQFNASRAYDRYVDEVDDDYCSGYSFREDRYALGNIILMMEENQTTPEKAIEAYLENVSWYPVRYKIREEMYRDTVNYPRANAKDFDEKYGKLIDEKRDRRLEEIGMSMKEWLADKGYISIVEFDDSYPERDAYETCELVDTDNRRTMDHH